MIPQSFEGEKAAAFYIKDGKETPTEWCTRCEKHYYDSYTKQAPLYIIRNMKTGKSYQMAVEGGKGWDDEEYAIVHFLDQNDVKGDEITQGDLSKIPNELLKHIPIPVGKAKGKTMANYNADKPLPDPNAGRKHYTDSKKAGWTKEQIVDKKHQRAILKELDDWRETKGQSPVFYKKYADEDICKVVSIDASFAGKKKDVLSKYVEKGTREENKWQPKARKIRYYFLGRPNTYVEMIVSKEAKIPASVNAATADGDERSVLQYTGFHEMGMGIPSNAREKINNIGTGFESRKEYLSKSVIKAAKEKYPTAVKEKKFEKHMEYYALSKLKNSCPDFSISNVQIGSFKYRAQPKRERDLNLKLSNANHVAVWNSGHAPGTKWNFQLYKNGELVGTIFVEFEKLPMKMENMKVWADDNSQFVASKELKEACLDISKHIFNSWRNNFRGEIVQNRVEGNYGKNMYEDIRNKFTKLIIG